MQKLTESVVPLVSRATRGAVLALVLGGACISTDSDVLEAGEGCDEFQPGTPLPAHLDLDPEARRFVDAASDFVVAGTALKGDVLTACANIARDLGAPDTWSNLSEDDAISNADGTGACDVAGRKSEALLVEAGGANANIAIAVTRGQCHVDFEAQAACEQQCAADAPCDPGTVETRCEPGSLSVVCETECSAEASCEGSLELPANCMGQCEAECQGECRGTCVAADGSVTSDDPSCQGKCSSSCNGTCRGVCKIEAPAGIECGAGVRCTGGCTGTFSDPVCETELTPPSCQVDPACLDACAARAAAEAVCEPTRIDVLVDLTIAPQLAPLVATLEANLPVLVDAAESRGRLLLDATERLAAAGESLGDRIEDVNGKSLACVGAASSSIAKLFGALRASVEASVRFDVTLETHTL